MQRGKILDDAANMNNHAIRKDDKFSNPFVWEWDLHIGLDIFFENLDTWKLFRHYPYYDIETVAVYLYVILLCIYGLHNMFLS